MKKPAIPFAQRKRLQAAGIRPVLWPDAYFGNNRDVARFRGIEFHSCETNTWYGVLRVSTLQYEEWADGFVEDIKTYPSIDAVVDAVLTAAVIDRLNRN